MRLDGVAGDGDHLDAALGELRSQLSGGAQLGGTHRREVGGVGEQNAPSETETDGDPAVTRGTGDGDITRGVLGGPGQRPRDAGDADHRKGSPRLPAGETN